MLAASLFMLNLIASWLVQAAWSRIFVVTALDGIATMWLFRILKLITRDDVERYVGGKNLFGLVLEKLLVQGT